MLRLVLSGLFIVAITGFASNTAEADEDSRSLLIELQNLLAQSTPQDTDCCTVLNEIKEWQELRLQEFSEVQSLVVEKPTDGSMVTERPWVSGTVADPNTTVWVIIHPMAVSDYWVQPSISVRKDGSWRVMISTGRPGTVDVGKHFEILAVGNPTVQLSEGLVLSGWPEAALESEIIEVIRK